MAKLNLRSVFIFCLLSIVYSLSSASLLCASEEFHCEVLKLKGEAKVSGGEGESKKLAEGDLLQVGQTVEVAADSYVDLAYDREWKNISRLEENTKITLLKIYPGQLDLKEGSVYARLKSLPKDSSFEVKTPTAVATVRGTEYRTLVKDGHTDVFNSSSSPIYVYGVNSDGEVNKKDLVVLKTAQKTSVEKAGAKPASPQVMTADEKGMGTEITEHIKKNITEVLITGRVSKIQSVSELEKIKLEDSDEEGHSSSAVPTEDSRVDDQRRRAFKKAS